MCFCWKWRSALENSASCMPISCLLRALGETVSGACKKPSQISRFSAAATALPALIQRWILLGQLLQRLDAHGEACLFQLLAHLGLTDGITPLLRERWEGHRLHRL